MLKIENYSNVIWFLQQWLKVVFVIITYQFECLTKIICWVFCFNFIFMTYLLFILFVFYLCYSIPSVPYPFFFFVFFCKFLSIFLLSNFKNTLLSADIGVPCMKPLASQSWVVDLWPKFYIWGVVIIWRCHILYYETPTNNVFAFYYENYCQVVLCEWSEYFC